MSRFLSSPGRPRRIVIFSRDELKQHEMALRFHDSRLRFFLGDVRDSGRLSRAFYGIDTVIHAAALKHVPSGEYNPEEVIKTNVHGAMNVIEAAIDCNVARVLALSTDKACNPVNLYGATKLCAEKLFTAAGAYVGHRRTRFAVLRYGNVANSRGSVIPLWAAHAANCRDPWEDISKCSGLPLTDPEMTRFCITLDQAVGFVIANLGRMSGGEVFVPKLPSVRMTDVAQAVAPDCRLEIIGIRPGEKLHEAMIGPDECYGDFGDYRIIGPDQPLRGAYTSDTNTDWLGVEQIRALLG